MRLNAVGPNFSLCNVFAIQNFEYISGVGRSFIEISTIAGVQFSKLIFLLGVIVKLKILGLPTYLGFDPRVS